MRKKIIIVAVLFLIISSLLVLFISKEKSSIETFNLESKYYVSGDFIEKSDTEIEKLIQDKESFILFTYNNYCSLPIPCEDIFSEGFAEMKINAIKVSFENFKKTSIYKEVKLAPSVIIFKDGEIITYLHADKDSDLDKYQDKEEFTNWVKKYVKIN